MTNLVYFLLVWVYFHHRNSQRCRLCYFSFIQGRSFQYFSPMGPLLESGILVKNPTESWWCVATLNTEYVFSSLLLFVPPNRFYPLNMKKLFIFKYFFLVTTSNTTPQTFFIFDFNPYLQDHSVRGVTWEAFEQISSLKTLRTSYTGIVVIYLSSIWL